MTAIRVLIVDDSAVVRQFLKGELDSVPGVEVVGQAADAYAARDKIVQLAPDVLTLDLQMPRMDGITFMRKLMQHHPLPVVVVSAFTAHGAQQTVEALAAGATDVVAKPNLGGLGADGRAEFRRNLADKIRAASQSRVQAGKSTGHDVAPVPVAPVKATSKVVACGASTGGTEALAEVLRALPRRFPPVVIVQHMPPGFTTAFAERLNALSQLDVFEAEDGMPLREGQALIARGGVHMLVRREERGLVARLKKGPPVCRHRPSVEALFDSLGQVAPRQTVAVLLTGMGKDGAEGLLRLRQAGAHTIAQDEASSVVYGMPAEAAKLGAAEAIVSLDKVPDTIVRFL